MQRVAHARESRMEHLVKSSRPESTGRWQVEQESSSGVVVRSTGAYEKLSGHPARPVLGWVARVEYPVPSHYTCQAAQSGYRESISWLFTCPSEET